MPESFLGETALRRWGVWQTTAMLVGLCLTGVSGQCLFGFGDRINPPECPFYEVTSALTQNEVVQVIPEDGGPTYTVTQIRTNVEAAIGYCDSFKYPRSDSGLAYQASGTVGAEEHSYIMTYGDPWCNTALLFTTCLEERPTRFHPPSYAVNLRPPVLHDPDSPTSPTAPVPPQLPQWDEGGYFYRTVTVRVNDSCLDPNFDPALEVRTDALATAFMSIVNGSVTYGFQQALNVSDPSSVNWARTYVTSRVAECPDFGSPQPECVVSHTTCNEAPIARCNSATRTRPIVRYPSRVELACLDPEYGYVWRVDNLGAPGLHFDWRLTRGNASFIDPIGAPGTLEIPTNTSRNPLYNASLIAGFWPGTSGKHTAAPLNAFFIPTWLDAGGVLRPSNLDLYAGYPSHYNGTTTLGALVAFFDFAALMDFDMLNAAGFPFFTYGDVPAVTFPGDEERQTVLHICQTAGLATAASNYVTGGTEDWEGWCTATVLNASATWPDALLLTQTTFTPLTPGDPDPMPACSCGSGPLVCGQGDALGDPLRFQYDYLRTSNNTADYRLEPVCRMPEFDPLNVTNLPPLSFFPGPSSPINETSVLLSIVQQYLADWPVPYEIIDVGGTDFLEYPTLPFGVMWNLSNVNRDTVAQPFTARLSFANTDGGVPDTAELTVPYEYIDSDIILNPLKSRWLLSRTLIGQNVFGHINWRCSNAATCEADATPKYPPDYSSLDPDYVASSEFAEIDVYLPLIDAAALPLCECFVNVPCDAGILLEETDLDVNVTDLSPPPGPPPGPPTLVPIPEDCVPTLETCNCLDDNCDGFVDNVLGVNATCGFSSVGQCELGVYACNVSLSECNVSKPLTCIGAVYPEMERCDNQDWNCDGVINNAPGLGQPCGTNVGVCEYGVWACDPPNPEPICVGGVQPEPEDICGNGLDDDCDGLIDFNCVPGPPPTIPPSPSPTPTPGLPPSIGPTPTSPPSPPTPTGPTPPTEEEDDGGGIQLPQIDPPALDISVAAIVISIILCLSCGGALLYCIVLRRNRRWKRQNYPLFY